MPVILSLDPTDVPGDGEVLLYDASSKKWRPAPGGVPDDVYTKAEVDTMVGSVTPPNILVQPGASDATAFPAGVDVIFT